MVKEHTRCRACGKGDFFEAINFGDQPLANDFIPQSDVVGYDRYYPLSMAVCSHCGLGQLTAVVSPDELYSHYLYMTNSSETMRRHLLRQKDALMDMSQFRKPSVLEIGSNTGVYLKMFQDSGCYTLGIEPAKNLAEISRLSGIETYCRPFTSRGVPEDSPWNIVIARHVFCHIDDWRDFIEALDRITDKNSVVAIETPYMGNILSECQFDTIYHEHLSYLGLQAMLSLLDGSPFYLYFAELQDIHGGSMLMVLRKRDCGIPCVDYSALVGREKQLNLTRTETWDVFRSKAFERCERLRKRLTEMAENGESVIGYGASAKSTVLLNAANINTRHISYIIDNTPTKQNLVCPGSWIPIKPPEKLLQDQPDAAVILAWNFANEITGREQEYQRRGGRFMLPF